MSQPGLGQLSVTNNMNVSAAELRNVHTEWGTDQSSLMLVQVRLSSGQPHQLPKTLGFGSCRKQTGPVLPDELPFPASIRLHPRFQGASHWMQVSGAEQGNEAIWRH